MPADVLIAALDGGVTLDLALGHLQEAKNFITWMKTSSEARAGLTYETTMQKLLGTERAIDRRLASGEPNVVAGRNLQPYWFHDLSHHEFSIGEVDGELKSLQVRCRNSRAQILDIQIDSGYKLPGTWEHCAVYVEAEPGTRFTLTEYPPEPASAAPAP